MIRKKFVHQSGVEPWPLAIWASIIPPDYRGHLIAVTLALLWIRLFHMDTKLEMMATLATLYYHIVADFFIMCIFKILLNVELYVCW